MLSVFGTSNKSCHHASFTATARHEWTISTVTRLALVEGHLSPSPPHTLQHNFHNDPPRIYELDSAVPDSKTPEIDHYYAPTPSSAHSASDEDDDLDDDEPLEPLMRNDKLWWMANLMYEPGSQEWFHWALHMWNEEGVLASKLQELQATAGTNLEDANEEEDDNMSVLELPTSDKDTWGVLNEMHAPGTPAWFYTGLDMFSHK